MAAAALAMDPRNPIEQINDALRGSVIDVLRVLIPELEPYSNEEAFNVILNSPEMSARAFRAFREHPEAFQHLLQGPNEEPVTNDNERLSCGRTLAQVVALIVQAVAKRYFRAKLGLKSKMQAKAGQQESGLVEKIVSFLKGPEAEKKPAPKPVSPADRLFEAMRAYLLYEWQLKLIPHYVSLPINLVTSLGAHLLDYHEVAEIQWMARNGRPLAKAYSRAADRDAPKPIIGGANQNDAKALAAAATAAVVAAAQMPVAHQTEVAAAPEPEKEPAWKETPVAKPQVEIPKVEVIQQKIPEGVDSQRFVQAVLSRVNPPLAKRLLADLGINAKQLAVVLIRAYEVLPSVEFQRFGAAAPDSQEATRFIAAALTAKFGAKTDPQTCLEFARLYLANVRSAI
jgi:hypothetical protein